ncbi:MAG: YlmC/YmxH family sporulation protein [Firmicutes bacterium]|jgi:YlmC/YmxH family sporulation protein|uniref:YlmC/YmxH family sporulation protein n=1 Tax=Sulfobacillus benefaciens TaxID=453960 RepID=A0A2T2X6Y4_9FIRM|nr:YlmC/YmxH family sporulation protein [Bacillota bacterium]MCL5013816.1 YlmC/YmxH family sporulation protein [Bacillota bacterium]PSR30227.1 MAG: YlmC/YmxH family sporulation protein [Sulfobacillus benefaciens]
MLKTSELRTKDVVNVTDGRRLGFVGDLELDLEGGHIKSVIVLGSGHLLGLFGRERDTVINWDQIRKIGQDVILVELQPSTAQTADS